jgi:hypothetical protein
MKLGVAYELLSCHYTAYDFIIISNGRSIIQTVPWMRKRHFKGTSGATFLRDYRALRR